MAPLPLSLQVFRHAVEASGEGVVVTDHTLPDNPIVYANPSFCALTGYDRCEVEGRNCRFLQNDDRDQPDVEILRAAIREERSARVLLRNYRKDGTLFWNYLHVAPVTPSDGEAARYFVGVAYDATHQIEARERQHKLTSRLRTLTHHLVQVKEDTQKVLALELHDQIGQDLTALKLTLERALQSEHDARLDDERLDGALQTVRRLQAQVRQLTLNLWPPLLESLGLLAALQALFKQIGEKADLKIEAYLPSHIPDTSDLVRITVYRITQEALTNVVRHAKTDAAVVRLEVVGDTLQLEIEDFGVGFDREQLRRSEAASVGLSGALERARMAGGFAFVESTQGNGTRVSAHIPLAHLASVSPEPPTDALEISTDQKAS